MQIVGHEFLELAKGLYLSEDKKGVIIDLYDFTDTKQKTPKEQIVTALFDNLKSNIQNIGSEVECVIVRTGSTQDKDPWYLERIELDSALIYEIFPKINKLILPDELYTNGDLANKANSMDAFYFSNLAYKEEQNGNLEKAEYYYKWGAEVDFYWGNKHYGDFLVDQGRYKEAEECFLKIAGRNDISGDGNAHYAHLLLDTERYDEAIKYYEYVLHESDTSPREGICVRMETLFYESDAPIWKKLGTFYFNSLMSYYTGIAEEFIEDILLARSESDNDEISSDAKKRLFTLYSKGKFLIPGLFSPYVVDLYDLIDLEKAKKYSPSSNSGDLEDPDNPFWLELDTDEFNNTLGEMGIDDIYKVEKMLQNRAKSDNDEIKRGAMLALLRMYYEGHYYVGSEYCECIGGFDEMKDFDKVCEASKVFVEFPDTLDEIDCDWTYFNTVMYYIEKEHTDNENAFKNRFIDGIIKYAEENSENIDDVINGIQENLEWWYDERDDKYPFYLGYIPKGCTFVPTMSFFYSWHEFNTELTSIVIPNTIKEIQDNAFYNCCNLTSVTLPDTLESIKADAFENTGITSIIIPEGVTEIEENTFLGCEKLEYVKLPTSLKIIGADAFYGCSSLTSIELPENLEKIEAGAFFGTGITHVKIPKSVSFINSKAFYSSANYYDDDCVLAPIECFDVDDDNENYCSVNGNLYTKDMKTLVLYACKKHEETFKIPDEVTKIGSFAFYNCTSLTDVIMPNGVTEIGSSAFDNCTSLTSIIIPDGVTKIDRDAFRECTSLTSVVIPDGVTEIGSSAFLSCTSLTSVVIPNGVTKIGFNAFCNCTSLTDVIIPENVTEIGSSAFYNCTSLTDIIIPENVTEIGSYAFYNCTSLTSIIIPNSVTKIDRFVFRNCSSLKTIYCEAESQPQDYHEKWISDCNAEVIWGYKK